jgi:hypothetical protein
MYIRFMLAAIAVFSLSGCIAAIPLASELLASGSMGSLYGVGYTQPNPFHTPATAPTTFPGPGYVKNAR